MTPLSTAAGLSLPIVGHANPPGRGTGRDRRGTGVGTGPAGRCPGAGVPGAIGGGPDGPVAAETGRRSVRHAISTH